MPGAQYPVPWPLEYHVLDGVNVVHVLRAPSIEPDFVSIAK